MAEAKAPAAANDIKETLQAVGLWQQFSKLPASHQREYLKWVEAAKKPETRARRIIKMCEMLSKGKRAH